MNSWMTSYLWDWVALRSSRSYIEPLLLLASKQKRWIWPFNDFLARTIEKPLERNPRDSWEYWVRGDIDITLEMMEQLQGFILDPCIERSRVGVEGWFHENARDLLELTKDGDGDEDLNALDAWERWWHSFLLLFFIFLLFFSFAFSLVHLVHPRKEREGECGMNGCVREWVDIG